MQVRILRVGDSVLLPVLTDLKIGNWPDVVRVMNSERVYVRPENNRVFWNRGMTIWRALNRGELRAKLK